ncbi:MAG: hypothetical protein CM15mV36_0040 [Caudoviricetes sp.]|nr:MAG: hypothetical protein CM15mV36_0040 [Caudoviricetes sp.]
MGCKIVDGRANQITDVCQDDNGCPRFEPVPADRTIGITYREYPKSTIRTNLNNLNSYSVNVSGNEGQAVMYPSVLVSATAGQATFGQNPGQYVQPSSAANCGKLVRASQICVGRSNGAFAIYDYFPRELSFGFQSSDTWFAYIYTMNQNAGQIGIASYIIEDEQRGSTGGTSDGTPTGDPLPSSFIANTICHPCANFTCTPASTQCSYTIESDLDYTGDPDCPHPTLFGIGTDSFKVVFTYDSLSTTIPNGVTDLSVSYDGTNYSDAWNEGENVGIQFDSPQNTWQAGDEAADTFTVYTLEQTGKTGLQVNIRIEPIVDESGTTVAFTGTRWTILDIVSPGTGYAVNDTFNISHSHTHPDNTVTNFTLTLKITAVGPIESQSGSIADLLRTGDTLNGHTITRVLHGPSVDSDYDTNEGLFPYHFAYLNGGGNDFTKNTSYTSNRNHQVTAIAGYGITDVGFFGGLYEFTDKSVQYTTGFVDRNAPDVYNSLVQPETTVHLRNGRVDRVEINENGGGSGWNTLGRAPELSITAPTVESGEQAEVVGEFTNGVLTNVIVTNQGSGYIESNLPQVSVTNVHKKSTFTVEDAAVREYGFDNLTHFYKTFPEAAEAFPELDQTAIQSILSQHETLKANVEPVKTYEFTEPNVEIKKDPNYKRRDEMVQRLFDRKDVTPLKTGLVPAQPYNQIDFVDLGSSKEAQDLKKSTRELFETPKNQIPTDMEALIQDQIPEKSVYDESYVETVRGPFSELPYASDLTKYFMRQFIPDGRQNVNISVTLGVTQLNKGHAHFNCSALASSRADVTDPNTGQVTSSTFSFPFGQVPQGPGCQDWSATGTMSIRNDFTNATQTMAKATRLYGNPYNVT